MKKRFTNIEENYLKAIYKLAQDREGYISTSAIADEMEVNAASVTDMIKKKLAEKKLVDYAPYKGVTLTDEGRKVAINIIRKHRIWEVFLVEKLHFKWSEVHDIAEQLEHIQSDELINRLDDLLGNPTLDPHGGPIPGRDGQLRKLDRTLLSEVTTGKWYTIIAVKNDTSELLHFLESSGLLLGTRIQPREYFDFDQSMLLDTPAGTKTISRKVAENLYVREG